MNKQLKETETQGKLVGYTGDDRAWMQDYLRYEQEQAEEGE